MLRKARRRGPRDFWLNYLLGHFWERGARKRQPATFERQWPFAPVATRPSPLLGRALHNTGDVDGAIAAFRKDHSMNPNCPVGRRPGQGPGTQRRAGGSPPRLAEGPGTRPAGPRGLVRLCPVMPVPWQGERWSLGPVRPCSNASKTAPTNGGALPSATSLACLLQPASGDESRRTVALVDRAVAAGPKPADPEIAFLQLVKGLAEYRQGRWEQAVALLQESAAKLPNRASPRLVLAMAQFQAGSPKEARKTLAVAVQNYNWEEPHIGGPPHRMGEPCAPP